MFVISSAIDQTDANHTVERRMSDGLRESGSSVTITSLTNAIAFFIGVNSSINALSSFCLFAGVGVIFLYLSSLTIFASFMSYDINRQMNKRTDCFGLCCCKETSVLFCRRKFLTENQKQWPFYGSKSEYVERLDYTTLTQKFLYLHFSKRLLTNSGICLVLLSWTGLIILAINACEHLTIDFRTSYLINGDSYIK